MPDFLTKEELRKLFAELANLSPYHVREFYRKAWRGFRVSYAAGSQVGAGRLLFSPILNV
jgi:hypothetical protein